MVQTPKRCKEGKDDYKVEMNSSSKKCNKPLMERRRRARINDSLNQLKSLVLQANGKEESNFSKLDKADILEMTVKHIAAIQQNGLIGSPTSLNASGNFAGGFSACAKETLGLLSTLSDVTGTSSALQAGLFNHLAHVPCSPNAGTVPSAPRHSSPGFSPQRHQLQQHGNMMMTTPSNSRIPNSQCADSRTKHPASPLEMPLLQKVSNNGGFQRRLQDSYVFPVRTNAQSSSPQSSSFSAKCTYSQSPNTNVYARFEIPSPVQVKQEPDNSLDYGESARDYSDSASEGSRSPSSDSSSPSNSKAWRPW